MLLNSNSSKRLYPYLRPYLKTFFAALACMVLFGASDGAVPLLLKNILDGVFDKKSPDLLYAIPVFLILFSLIRAALDFGQQYLMSKVGHLIVRDLRNKLAESLLKQGNAYFITHSVGDLTAHFTSDVLLVRGILVESVAAVMRDVVRIIALLAAAFYLDPVLAAIAFLVFPIGVIPISQFGKRLRKLGRRGQDSIGSLNSVLQEMLLGHKVSKIFTREDFEQARFERENTDLTRTFIKSEKVRAFSGPVNEFLGTLAISGVLLYGGYSVLHGTRSQGEFIAFLMSVFLLYDPFKRLSRVHNTIQQGMGGVDRIFKVLDAQPEIVEPSTPVTLPASQDISFESVSYTYPGKQKPVLQDLSLEIPQGSRFALVGLSGSGKSTLVDFIPRFMDPDAGVVKFGGVDVKQLSLKQLRSQIALVSQHTFLFHDTIMNNIRYGKLDASDQEVYEAAATAFAHEFIMKIPHGYQHIVGEGGYALSGGERQRIALARAILKKAPVLILDEATASLDNQSEKEVQQALDNLLAASQGKQTIIMIAHRLSTVKNADIIAVIEQGKLVERGTHMQLLEKEGAYSRLNLIAAQT